MTARHATTILALILFAACGTEPTQSPTERETPSADPHALVTPQFLTSADQLLPGGKFFVAISFTIAPDTHIYWRNPGDSGLATGVEWDLPEGFSAGPLQWPNPHRFEIEEIQDTSYGFTDELVLLAEITPPDSLTPGDTITLKAEPYWLACMDDGQCIPGSAEVSHEFIIADQIPSSDFDRLDDAYTTIPKPISEFATQIQLETQDTEFTITAVEPWTFQSDAPPSAYPFGDHHWNPTLDANAATFKATTEGAKNFAGTLTIPMTNTQTNESTTLYASIGNPPADL